MLFKEINQKFTEMVAEFMAQGYYINAGTMRGSQSNEIASVDLTNGAEIIRVCMVECYRSIEDETRRHYGTVQGIRVFAGRVTKENIRANSTNYFGMTIWNDELEVIAEESYYEVGRPNRNGSKAYGTYEEAVDASVKVRDRYLRQPNEYPQKELTSQRAKEVALAWVQKQPRKKSVKLTQIEKVYRVNNRANGGAVYHVMVKGEDMVIR